MLLRRASSFALPALICLELAACNEGGSDSEETDSESGDGDGDGESGDGEGDGDGDPQACAGEAVPTNEAELVPWLESGAYETWLTESAVHESSGPHFGGVRTFVDDCLATSLDADATEHPPGSATIKELYGDGEQILGWSVMVKVAAGTGGDTWYWFERYGDTVYADAIGSDLCTDCHGAGTDHFLSPWPLQ